MKEVTKDMIIGDMLAQDMSIAAILMNAGMHCIGCPSSQGESLEEACLVHGFLRFYYLHQQPYYSPLTLKLSLF